MKKVLVVDDNLDIAKLVSTRLRLNNYQVISAQSGREGLEKARRENPDLILLDVTMPDMDGYETLEKIKEDGQIKSIPVIMLTAKSQVDDLARAVQAGAVDYIVKPFDTAALLEKAKKALSRG
jgi:DNA-binding response OmpR family regulator